MMRIPLKDAYGPHKIVLASGTGGASRSAQHPPGVDVDAPSPNQLSSLMNKMYPNCRLVPKSAIAAFSLFVLALPLTATLANAADITNIKEIINNTGVSLEVLQYDFTPGVASANPIQVIGSIPAHGVWSGDMWVPWLDNRDDFASKHIAVRVRKGIRRQPIVILTIWQSGPYVRYNRADDFVPNGPLVPGVARSNGNRRVVVSQSGSQVTITFQEM